MRILNRPMFRYGGPIKEGVMHGMKNGGRAALVGNPVYPKTDGREHHAVVSGTIATVAGLNALRHAAMRVGARYLPRIISRAKRMFGTTTPASITKGGPRVGEAVGSHTPITINPAKFNPNWLGRDPLVRTVGAAGKAIFNPTVGGWAGKAARFATSPSTLIGGLWFANGRWFNKKGDELDPNSTEVANAKAGAKWDPGAGADQYDPSTSPAARAAAAKKARTEKLSKYLDMMGYDRAKKTAMSDALIDASAIVQQGTEEGGSLKHADWSKMINQAIQTTSKRLDKPEQIREAVGLMTAKAAIEKDASAEDDALNKLYKQMQIKIGQKTLAGDTFEEIISERMVKGDMLQGKDLASLLRLKKGIDAKVLPSTGIKADVDALDYVKKTIKAYNDNPETGTYPAGVYVISDRIIEVDEQGNVSKVL